MPMPGKRSGSTTPWSPEDIRNCRVERGLTAEDLAHQIGVTVSTVSRWECGHAAPSRMACLALDAWRHGFRRES